MFVRVCSVVAAFALALSAACLPARSPYDPEAPLELQAKAELSGHVFADLASDLDESPPPVADATIVLTLVDGSEIETTTDEEGAFILSDFFPGDVTIDVSHPLYQRHRADLPALAPGERRDDHVIYLSRYASDDPLLELVAGTVVRDRKDNHGGIDVRSALDPSVVLGTTQPDGRLELRLPAGSQTLLVEEYGFETTEIPVDVSPDSANDFGTVTLPFIPGMVSGTVAVEDSAVAGIVSLSLDKGGVDVVSADGDGNYFLPVVPLGTYVLTASAPGHDDVSVAGVEVVPTEETSVAAIYLTRSRGSIAGVARFAPGFDDDNSGIVVSVAGTSASGVTDADGNFLIEAVPSVADTGYTLTVTAADFLTQTVAGVLVAKNETTLLEDPIVLAKQIGDFEIVSTDPAPLGFPAGYTKTPDVALRLSPIPLGAVQLRIGEDPDLSGVPYGPIPADVDAVPYTLQGADGQIAVYVQYEIDDGSEAGPFSSAIVLDQVAPDVASPLLADGSGFTNQNSIIVSVSAQDDTSAPYSYDLSEDMTFGGLSPIVTEDYGLPSTFDFVDQMNDGPRTIYARVVDLAGNISDPVAAMIVRDTVPAVLTSFSMDCQGTVDAAVCRDTTVSLTIDSPDATDWYVSLLENPPDDEGDWRSFADPLFFAGLSQAPGMQTLYLYLRDGAGNVSDSFSDVIEVDTQPPTGATVQIENGAAFIPGGTTLVNVSLFALGATDMRISTDADTSDDPTVAYATSQVVNVPGGQADGPFTIYVTFVDAAGNEVTVNDSRERVRRRRLQRRRQRCAPRCARTLFVHRRELRHGEQRRPGLQLHRTLPRCALRG